MSVLPSGTVLHSLLSLLGLNIKCGWALPNLYFSASVLLLGRCTGYGGTGKIHIVIPVASQDQVACHMAGHACDVLLHISQVHRLSGGSRAMHSLTPPLLLPLRFFLALDGRRKLLYKLSNVLPWQNGAGKYWNRRCAASILLIPSFCKLEPPQFEICWR